jgi:hypothetical protein
MQERQLVRTHVETSFTASLHFLALLPLLFVVLLFIVCVLQQCFFLPIGDSSLLCALFFTALTVSLIYRGGGSLSLTRILVLSFSSALITALFIFTAAQFYDVSFDGQIYHQEAIRQFASGWNYFSPLTFAPSRQEMDIFSFSLLHYCKLPWLVQAVIFRLTGDIETAKALNWLLVWAAFYSCFALLELRAVPRIWALCLALLAALNPVALTQLNTFYIDGLFASAILSLVCFYFYWILRPSAASAVALCCAIVLTVHIKFTATVAAVALLTALGVHYFWQNGRQSLRRLALPATALLISFFVLGYHPFLTNYLKTGNIFFPIPAYSFSGVSQSSVAFQEVQLPANFQGHNRFTKFIFSLFSESANPFSVGSAVLKPPWRVALAEFRSFSIPDVRTAGFGPLFAAALLLSLALLAWLLCQAPEALLLPLLLLFSVLLNPECWWARYTPQLWLVPLAICLQQLQHTKKASVLAKAIVLLLAINLGGISIVSLRSQFTQTAALKSQLLRLAAQPINWDVDFKRFRLNELRLKSYGISFIDSPGISCANPEVIYSSPTTLCPNK